MNMNNISKISMIFAISLMILSTGFVQNETFYDDSIEFTEENYNQLILVRSRIGETINIDITDFTGNVSMRISDYIQVDGFVNISKVVIQDATISIKMNTSSTVAIQIWSNEVSSGYFKVYSEGISYAFFIYLGISVSLLMGAILIEQFWRTRNIPDYIKDEVQSLKIRPFVLLVILSIPLLWDTGHPELLTKNIEKVYFYSWDFHIYSVIQSVINPNSILLFSIFLVALTSGRTSKTSRVMMYSVYPINALEQYKARMIVYMSVHLAFMTYLNSPIIIGKRGDFAGFEYIPTIYLPAFLYIALTYVVFLFIHVLLLDIVRKRNIIMWISPILLFISSLFGMTIYPFGFLNQPYVNNPDPFRIFRPVLLLFTLVMVLYLNKRYRRSKFFIAY